MNRQRSSTEHVFISYVREDSKRVDRLQRMLEAKGIAVWRDTSNLWPGQDWKIEIRRAIGSGVAFIACFSEHTGRRTVSYQNEELIFAIELMRERWPGRVWLLPVRFTDCQLPLFDLGAGRTLDSIQRTDLFGGAAWDPSVARLVSAVRDICNGPEGQTARPEKRPQSETMEISGGVVRGFREGISTASPPGSGSGDPPRLRRARRHGRWTSLGLSMMVALALLAIGFGAYRLADSPRRGAGQVAGTSSHLATARARAKPSAQSLSPTPSQTPSDVVIRLTAYEDCWVLLTKASDGSQIYMGVIPAGSSKMWTEKEPVKLHLGNPGGITLTVNGQRHSINTVQPVTLSLSPSSGST